MMDFREHITLTPLFGYKQDASDFMRRSEYIELIKHKYGPRIHRELHPFIDLYRYTVKLINEITKDSFIDYVYKEALLYVVYLIYEEKYLYF